ncbi:hypothetical protein [Litorivivens sp.]|uniref:hypothetical protein n=1 Tax=Litorivivens sp. TaxID=2020868 RepID=UPI0035615317
MSNSGNNSSSKLVFSLIVGIPLLVIAFSSLLYMLANRDVVSLGTVNNGTLIQPPLQIDKLAPIHRNGEPVAFNEIDSLWQFVVIGDGYCEANCEAMLYLTRQTHTALGKKMGRVGRMYLNTDKEFGAQLDQLLIDEHEKLTSAFIDGAAFRASNLPLGDEARGFYVVDPKGWVMMFYQLPDLEQETLTSMGKLVIKDMKRLLR